jgi:hypothetical protein
LRHDAERPEEIGNGHALAGAQVVAPLDRQELPDPIPATRPPWPEIDEACIEESAEGPVDTLDIDTEPVRHPTATVVRGTAAVGGEREQEEHCRGVGLESL